MSVDLEKSKVLDLYAGTGSFGLECLSRQAERVYFVENKKEAIKILKLNIEKLKLKNKTQIFFKDVFKLLKKEPFFQLKFDIILSSSSILSIRTMTSHCLKKPSNSSNSKN